MHSLMMFIVLSLALVGAASPFAVGEADSGTYQRQHVAPSVQSTLFRAPTPVATQLASTVTNSEPSPRGIRSLIRNLNPSGGAKDGRWKGGETKATVASRLLFTYINPLIEIASKRNLDANDALHVATDQKMNHIVTTLSTTYDDMTTRSRKKIEEAKAQGSEKAKNSRSLVLLKALLTSQKRRIAITAILRLINTGIQAFPPILLARLLRLIEAGEAFPLSKACIAASALVAVLYVKMVTENQFFHNIIKMSTQTRGSLEGLIFDKSLRLPGGGASVLSVKSKNAADERKALGSGGVLNLMQSDASIIESAASQIHTLWDGPLQIIMYSSLLYKYLGPSVLYGFAVLLTVIPLNSVTLRVLDRLARAENEAKDGRTRRTTESINNMKLLKVQAWEKKFAQDIESQRETELDRHKVRGMVRALNSAISNAVPALVLVVTLTAYAKTGKPIVASTIFTAISLFNQLRFPLFFYPMLIDSLANGKNALRRLSSYLASEEMTQYVQAFPASKSGGSIKMRNGNFLWTSKEAPKDGEVAKAAAPALCGANMHVATGETVAIVGPVGSGKSALVKALLGELEPVPRRVVDPAVSSDGVTLDEFYDKAEVTRHGDVAYCSQQAWLPKGTIREAIIFGREYDEQRYLSAIYDAGLDNDIMDSIEGGNSQAATSSGVLSHDTDVGEGGSSLSGGQRARVALARALYCDDNTKVFLLDDCLAALDASVGSTVFERLKKRLQSSNAAAVIVTNDPSLPRRCDRVVLMGSMGSSSCSTIVDQGSYDELIQRGHKLQSFDLADFEEMLAEDAVGASSVSNTTLGVNPEHQKDMADEETRHMVRVVGGYKVPANGTEYSCHADPDCEDAHMQNWPDSMADKAFPNDKEMVIATNSSLPQTVNHGSTDAIAADTEGARSKVTMSPKEKAKSADDKMSSEAVPLSIYFSYLKAVRNPSLVLATLGAFGVANGAQFFQQYIVAKWTELSRVDSIAAALGAKYLQQLVYAAGVVSVALWLRSFLMMLVGIRASKFYHTRMVSSIFKAPMSFFDATPSGQILSRFGKELETVDRSLPDSLASVLFCALQISSSVAALAGAITPAMLLPIVFIGSLYAKVMGRFRPAARDLKRTETKTRAPIFTNFGEALRGTEVIRSIPGASAYWTSRHRSLSDSNLAVFSTVKALDRWLSCSLETLGNLMVFVTALASVALTRSGKLSPGSAGWGLTQALSITGLMAWTVRNLTNLESNMMSVMRVQELTDIDAEAGRASSSMPRELSEAGAALQPEFGNTKLSVSVAPVNDRALLADGWPWLGGVQFRKVSMRYNPSSPLVLKDVSLSVPPGTTLGVVGRTGSGKSSLLLTLFRIIEIENGGSIAIDGVDIRSVSIQTLREKLSIIPQDPVLFTGSVAYNLDANGRASVSDMWACLEAASPELATQFRESGGLDFAISEGGSNLSLGQRQLICLARALLRKSKILVLDEATSSVDAATDQQVQDTIRSQFVDKGVSVITVAHRLDTVLGYDKIAVLGDGNVLEYDTPSNLLQLPGGELRQLVDADRENKRMGGQVAPELTVA